MSIGRFSLLEETQNSRLVSRLNLPVNRKSAIKFNEAVNKLFNAKEVQELTEKEFKRAYYSNKITLIQGILTISDYDLGPVIDYYKEIYNIDFKDDFTLIVSDLKKYLRIMKEPIKSDLKPQPFEALVSGVEQIVGPIPRSMKLYQFKHKIEYANAYVKAQEQKING